MSYNHSNGFSTTPLQKTAYVPKNANNHHMVPNNHMSHHMSNHMSAANNHHLVTKANAQRVPYNHVQPNKNLVYSRPQVVPMPVPAPAVVESRPQAYHPPNYGAHDTPDHFQRMPAFADYNPFTGSSIHLENPNTLDSIICNLEYTLHFANNPSTSPNSLFSAPPHVLLKLACN